MGTADSRPSLSYTEKRITNEGQDMQYLKSFTFPDRDQEFDFFLEQKRTCYTDFYPFQVLSSSDLTSLQMAPVTILHGGNGSGKTTALNVMAERLGAVRDSAYNKSCFFPDYVKRCREQWCGELPEEIRIITSDDVFDYMLDLRHVNAGIDRRREEMFAEYYDLREGRTSVKMESLDDYEKLKRANDARRKRTTQSRFVREHLAANVQERSNGESAFMYFTEKIRENGLYLLDEPENSLSPGRQQELVRFLEDSVRFFGCQFIIATHSPFMLAIRDARIYDLDECPVTIKPWTQLKNVQQYYQFFREHAGEFENNRE